MEIAVIVTTYNRPDALAAVLESYCAQQDRHFRIVIADDGSGPETAAVVERYRTRPDLAIDHIWQEDRGFRAGGIRNRALAQTRADYVVFTDGDCLALPGFVAGHRRLAERGWFIAGNRILIGERATRRILDGHLPVHTWSVGKWLRAFLKGEVNRFLPTLPFPLPGWLRKLPARQWQGVMTCNLSAWREDLLRLNGFDEEYEGWGLEDSDLTVRLLRSGIRRKSGRFVAPVIHLWHPENNRASLEANRRRLDALNRSREIRASRGMDQYC